MNKEKAVPSLMDFYSRAGRSCAALWPLAMVEFVFLILQYATLVFCLVIAFGPVLKEVVGRFSADAPMDWKWVTPETFSFFKDPAWIAICAGLCLLYALWWFLLTSFSAGGTFGCFWRHSRTGQTFSLPEFFRDGSRHFGRMILLQFLLFMLGLGLLAVFALAALLVVAVLALADFNTVAVVIACIIPGVPALMLFVFLAFLLSAYSYAAKGCLTTGLSARAALAEAARRCRANNWQVLMGLVLVFAAYMAVSFALSMAFGVLESIPFVGSLFLFPDILASALSAILLAVYLPSLSVVFLGEEGA